jgi:hypothetical protein
MGNWTFVFLGANMDAFAQGGKLGIPARNAQIFDPENYVGAYANLSKRTNAVSAALEKASRDFFKSEAGDKKPS